MWAAAKNIRPTMICGDGCGGTIKELTETEMNAVIEEKRNEPRKVRFRS
jgi:hypothetical protein